MSDHILSSPAFWWPVPSRNNAPNILKVRVFGRHQTVSKVKTARKDDK